jgi:hypothetical protein
MGLSTEDRELLRSHLRNILSRLSEPRSSNPRVSAWGAPTKDGLKNGGLAASWLRGRPGERIYWIWVARTLEVCSRRGRVLLGLGQAGFVVLCTGGWLLVN